MHATPLVFPPPRHKLPRPGEDQVLMRYAVVTPARILFGGPDVEETNELMEHASVPREHVLRVRFRDENEKRPMQHSHKKLIRNALDGVVQNGRGGRFRTPLEDRRDPGEYVRLNYTQSGLKSKSLLFVKETTDRTADKIRAVLGDFSSVAETEGA